MSFVVGSLLVRMSMKKLIFLDLSNHVGSKIKQEEGD